MSRRGQAKEDQYVGPYRLEKTLGKGQTGNENSKFTLINLRSGKIRRSLHKWPKSCRQDC